jgi:hypothetical protein
MDAKQQLNLDARPTPEGKESPKFAEQEAWSAPVLVWTQ